MELEMEYLVHMMTEQYKEESVLTSHTSFPPYFYSISLFVSGEKAKGVGNLGAWIVRTG